MNSPTNGRVSYSRTSRTYNSWAYFYCNTGYTRDGISSARCLASGQWSGSEPDCKPVECRALSNPANGRVSYSSRTFGNEATYSCNTGYNLTGPSTVTCQADGEWSEDPPDCPIVVCPALNSPTNGRVSYSRTSRTYNSWAYFYCNTGYNRDGTFSTRCLASGQWSGSEPDCEPVECPALSDPPNGRVSYSSRTYGNVARYSCNTGYTRDGPSTVTCQANRQWSGSRPDCEPVVCPTLSNPTNGRVSYSDSSRIFNSRATYSCNTGYNLVGLSSVTCLDSGHWSGPRPNCPPVECSALSNPPNGRVSYNSRTYGNVAHYSCNTGYSLDGSSSVTCLASGEWSGPRPECPIVECPTPSNPTNGRVSYSSHTYGSVARYSCNTGYNLEGSSSVTCQASGGWSGSPPECPIKECPALSNPTNGRVSYSSRDYGSRAYYNCNIGYKLVGPSSVTCQDSEEWSGSQPTCQIKVCPTPSSPTNGRVSYSSRNYGSRAHYYCNTGYTRVGSFSRTCQNSEQWSGTQPVCNPIICPTPRAPTDGSVNFTTIQYPATAHYSCDLGYRLEGPTSRQCQLSGTWSGQEPSCIEIRCPTLSSPPNGRVSVTSYYPGGTATYSCYNGYRRNPSSDSSKTRFCMFPDGVWMGVASSCERITCPTIEALRNGTMTVSSNMEGGVASFSCDSTHYMVGSEQLTCQASGEWDEEPPSCIEKCKPSIGFEQQHLTVNEGDKKHEVCLQTCSACSISSNLTVEVKARYQADVGLPNSDLLLLERVIINETSTCFDLHIVDDHFLEGFEAMSIILYKPNGEDYHICEDSSILSVGIIADDVLIIGFEEEELEVNETVGSVEICVVVHNEERNVPLPDVVLQVRTWNYDKAKKGEDYVAIEGLPLPISDTNRRACFSLSIIDNTVLEPDEKFSIVLERNSSVDHWVPLDLDPQWLTVTILDNDGVTVGFENGGPKAELNADEGSETEVCIKARFASETSTSFTIGVSTRGITAVADEDYENINNLRFDFTHSAPKRCFTLSVKNDLFPEDDEIFTLEIEGEPAHVKVGRGILLVTIPNDDEPEPCDSILAILNPDLPCTSISCKYPIKCTTEGWTERPGSTVDVPEEKCPSRKILVKDCSMEATEGEGCERKNISKAECVDTTVGKLTKAIGAGSGAKRQGDPQTTGSPPRSKRSGESKHCPKPQNALYLDPSACNAFNSECQYSNGNQSRDPKTTCTKRSVLFILDSSYSIGYDVFKNLLFSLSYFVKHLCGDVQFSLLKYSSGAYLEFCFNCFSNEEREQLQERIKSTEYLGHSSYTGYAAKCANNFIFDSSSSCGNHDGRCIDIVFITDGQSSDRAYFDVCDQVECLHRNPQISDRLNIYAVNIGISAQEEVECITRFSRLRDGNSPIFNFDTVEDFIDQMNSVIRLFGVEEHKFRKSGKRPEYQCYDWLKGN